MIGQERGGVGLVTHDTKASHISCGLGQRLAGRSLWLHTHAHTQREREGQINMYADNESVWRDRVFTSTWAHSYSPEWQK